MCLYFLLLFIRFQAALRSLARPRFFNILLAPHSVQQEAPMPFAANIISMATRWLMGAMAKTDCPSDTTFWSLSINPNDTFTNACVGLELNGLLTVDKKFAEFIPVQGLVWIEHVIDSNNRSFFRIQHIKDLAKNDQVEDTKSRWKNQDVKSISLNYQLF